MSSKSKCITILFNALLLNSLCEISASPASKNTFYDKDSPSEVLVQVPFGETVTLECRSNDENHSFLYWHLNEKNTIVGPSNPYDNGKFKYEVLSGNLTIKAVSQEEEGIYNCVSRGVRQDDFNIRSVRMVVQKNWDEVYEHDSGVNLFRVVIIIGTLMILGGLGYVVYRIWKNRYRRPNYLVPSDDEDDSGDELFRAPGVSQGSETLAKTNSTESFDTPGISTDFKSILDTANNK